MDFITDTGYQVRVRATGIDKYAGLKGAEYIKARGLAPRPNHSVTSCAHCAQMEMLPAVLQIIDAFSPRAARRAS